jgi:hypothetical protein
VFDVDERAIGVGVRLMAATALTALHANGPSVPGRSQNGEAPEPRASHALPFVTGGR